MFMETLTPRGSEGGKPLRGPSPRADVGSLAQPRVDHWSRALNWLHKPRSPRTVVVWLSMYLAVAANWPLWSEIARLVHHPLQMALSVAGGFVILIGGTTAVLSLTAWSHGMRSLWIAVVVIASVAQHYMLAYGAVMSTDMIANVAETDPAEVFDLLTWQLAQNVLPVLVPAAWWLWRVPLVAHPVLSQGGRIVLLAVAALVITFGGLVVMNKELAPLVRSHGQLRYMLNPLSPLTSAVRVAIRPGPEAPAEIVKISAGAALGASHTPASRPPLLVLVMGETARADHFGINGYARDTTPQLAARSVLSYREVRSCGTSTRVSLPCMFSAEGSTVSESRHSASENLLDLLHAAGFAVLWIGNQAGCKNVCDRVPSVEAGSELSAALHGALCSGAECLDEALLHNLDRHLDSLPAQRSAKGVVLVLHQMGSHGPAYHRRSPASHKPFLPECKTSSLADCSPSELINAYDNSIAYTDAILGATIDWLQTKHDFDAGLLYVSDHGESLGEYGLYLHGLPYAIAPDVQKHVPLVAWLSPNLQSRLRLTTECLRRDQDFPRMHDNFFHTVLGVADVVSPHYRDGLDMFSRCRG